MIDPSIPPLVEDTIDRLETAFGVRGDTLAQTLHKVGRRLPPRELARANVLRDAEQMMGHPKLSRQVDAQSVTRAHQDLIPFLDKQNLNDARKGRVIGVIATMMVNLLILAIVIAVVLAVVER